MGQWHNELIPSPNGGDLLLARHADSNDVIIKVSHDIGDSRTFEFFIIHSTKLCLNDVLIFFV